MKNAGKSTNVRSRRSISYRHKLRTRNLFLYATIWTDTALVNQSSIVSRQLDHFGPDRSLVENPCWMTYKMTSWTLRDGKIYGFTNW